MSVIIYSNVVDSAVPGFVFIYDPPGASCGSGCSHLSTVPSSGSWNVSSHLLQEYRQLVAIHSSFRKHSPWAAQPLHESVSLLSKHEPAIEIIN